MSARGWTLLFLAAVFGISTGAAPNWGVFIPSVLGLFLFLFLLFREIDPNGVRRPATSSPKVTGRPKSLAESGLSQELAELTQGAMEAWLGYGQMSMEDLSTEEIERFRRHMEVAVGFLASALFGHWLNYFVDAWSEGALCPAAADTANAVARQVLTTIQDRSDHLEGWLDSTNPMPGGPMVKREDVHRMLAEGIPPAQRLRDEAEEDDIEVEAKS